MLIHAVQTGTFAGKSFQGAAKIGAGI